LSKFAFEWMTREAALAGLLVDRARIEEVMGRTGTKYAKADHDAKMHESLTLWWRPAEIVPKKHWSWQKHCEERRMNLAHRRTLPDKPLVHAVAFLRKNYSLPPGAIRVDTAPW
jgi:hypothetical protein